MAPPKKSATAKVEKVASSIVNFLKSPKQDSTEGLQPRKRLKREEEDTPGSPVLADAEGDENESKASKTVKSKKKPTVQEMMNTLNFEEMDSRPHLIGAHVSIAGGVHNALIEARQLGASSAAFFLRPPKNFSVKPLSDEAVELWKKTAADLKFNLDNIVVHAPYLLNIGSPNGEALERSRNVLIDDLQRCDKLGIKYYNIHPGSTLNQISAEKCCKMIAESINMGLKKTKSVILLLENMAGQGNWVGSNFKELGMIISDVEDKTRVGVCIDTCHAFAYGYGLNTAKGLKRMLDDFSKHVGMDYLKALHVNDSKGACGDNKDRHEDIGKGVIGKAGFKLFMNEPAFRGLPAILETPGGVWDTEIPLLHSMVSDTDKLEKE